MNVTPVEPAIRSTVSKVAKSLCELPYGPSMSAMCEICTFATASEAGRRDVVELSAERMMRDVKPLCALRMNTNLPL